MMYNDSIDFTKISKAIESAYEQLKLLSENDDILNELKEAEYNLQMAMNYSLSSRK